MPYVDGTVSIDDFVVAVGKTKSNSVYHVAEVTSKPHPKVLGIIRYTVKCFKSDLIVALSRDSDQRLIPVQWYSSKN